MSLKRTICGMEWRVYSPSAYILADNRADKVAVFYDLASRCWRIGTQKAVFPYQYTKRNEAMAALCFAERLKA